MRPTTQTHPTRQTRNQLAPSKRTSRALTTLLIALTSCGPIAAALTTTTAQAEACPNQTLRNGPSQTLPDCRAYEQVSPPIKDGSAAVSPLPLYPAQAAPSGEGVVYMSNGPFPGAPSTFLPDAHLSNRTNTGWQTTDVTPPSLVATPSNGLSAGTPDYAFSEDLSQVVVKVVSPPRSPSGEQLYNLFLTRNGSTSLVNTAAPSEFPPEGAECYELVECFFTFDLAAFAGASSNFDRILFETNDSLIGTGAPGGFVENLYEASAGQLHLVGVLPDGVIAPGGAQPGGGGTVPVYTSAYSFKRWFDIRHSISADGTRVLFRATADGGPPDESQNGMVELYDRLEGSHTVEVSAPAAGAAPANTNPEPAQFRAASSDGSQAFFTSTAELTTNSKTGAENNSPDIYRYDVNHEALTDITIDTNPIDAATGAGVMGVTGASEDGSSVYFVASGELVKGEGVDGQPNLYVWHEDPTTHKSELNFIATLAGGDKADWTSSPSDLRGYVTPDGRHLAFTSLKSLTGYDNSDPLTHQVYSEIYEYSAQTHALVCASCNPTGAPPVGSAFTGTTFSNGLASTAFYQPRILSDDGGRLFFSSPDPLVAGSATASTKLYEYEQPGAGSCESEHGCIYRISSGYSGAGGFPDMFVDADATGSNVFFASASQLAPTDGDGLLDVYDARVDGGIPAPSGSSLCLSNCSSEGISTAPADTLPGSQQVSGNVATQPGKAAPPPRAGKKAKPRTCQAKARKLASRRARARALKRCPTSSHKRTSHRRAR